MMSLAVRVPFDDPLFHPKKMYVNGNSTRLLHPSCFTALYIPTYQNAIYQSQVQRKTKHISADAIFFFLKRIKTHFCYTSSRDLEMKTLGKALGGPSVTPPAEGLLGNSAGYGTLRFVLKP